MSGSRELLCDILVIVPDSFFLLFECKEVSSVSLSYSKSTFCYGYHGPMTELFSALGPWNVFLGKLQKKID